MKLENEIRDSEVWPRIACPMARLRFARAAQTIPVFVTFGTWSKKEKTWPGCPLLGGGLTVPTRRRSVAKKRQGFPIFAAFFHGFPQPCLTAADATLCLSASCASNQSPKTDPTPKPRFFQTATKKSSNSPYNPLFPASRFGDFILSFCLERPQKSRRRTQSGTRIFPNEINPLTPSCHGSQFRNRTQFSQRAAGILPAEQTVMVLTIFSALARSAVSHRLADINSR